MKIDLKKYKKYDIIHTSASKINSYYVCPRQFFFREMYLWEKKPIQNVWPATGLGESVHKVLELSSQSLKNKINEEEVIDNSGVIFKTHYDEWLIKNKQLFKKSRGYEYDGFIKDGKKYSKLLSSFLVDFSSGFFDLNPEFKFEIEYQYVKDIIFHGVIDLIYWINKDKYRIIDFKTTKDSDKFYFIDWITDTQSLMYIYYCINNYKIIPDFFSYLVFNHNNHTLFFKEYKVGNIENEKKFFSGLTYQINDIKEFMHNPDMRCANPEPTKCYWCEFNNWCEHKYESDLKKNLKKALKG